MLSQNCLVDETLFQLQLDLNLPSLQTRRTASVPLF